LILADSSIWIDHLHKRDEALADLLERGRILVHPFVIGEVALGHVRNRALVVHNLKEQPQASIASDEEVLQLIEHGKLAGTGIGYIDAHLLASVRITPGLSLWTRDRRLNDVAVRLGIAAKV
jgi:predicted nucleic acid-binding protein